ncbi:MAG: serine/threonine-protein kinase [Acidobacteria bacterium]|nr:serine/threonine-protein kinase [Acidobacteriota bacterium]
MLAAGSQLGPYEVLGKLGSGAMGEVYRAKDARLAREVAIKVLPPAFAADPDRLRRFEQEARAAGMLNHPNILAIYDIGTHEGSPYLVSELLQGETLRDRLKSGTLGLRKTIDYGLQTARGLAAAHDKGITHRDLKPENIFLTKDGRVKILDFGLAKLTRPEAGGREGSNAPTIDAETQPGTLLGTVGYMSPEQVRGRSADSRSDIFALGAILYEMSSGRRAFAGESAGDTMSAILKEDPPEISATNQNFSPALDRIIRHCLEKSPEERFQSAQDIAFNLEMLSGAIGPTTVMRAMEEPSATAPASAPRPLVRRLLVPILVALGVLVGLAVGLRFGRTTPPSFRQLSFRRGRILSARFAPDGHTIVYGAAWDGRPVELFSTRPESPESRPLGFPATEILAISPTGEMAISLRRRSLSPLVSTGMLARASLAGGAPREVLEDVEQADWAPDESNLAVAREVGGRNRLEFPIGKVLYLASGWISHPRVSPQGDLVAFIDHPVVGDDGGDVAVVDLAGKKKTLSSGWISNMGLAWSPKGDEVWFTATRVGGARALYAVSLGGKERVVARVTGPLTLDDIARDGRVLVTHDNGREGMIGLAPGEKEERDLSWLDFSAARDLSPDGKTVLFDESGEGGGATYSVYIRKTDGSPAVRIGEGNAAGLSPDGKWALSINSHGPTRQLVLLPTGAGTPQSLPPQGIHYQYAAWFPDGKRLLIMGDEPGHAARLYMQDVSGGKPRPIGPEGVTVPRFHRPVSSDGRWFIGRSADGRYSLYPVEGGEPRAIPGLAPEDVPFQWGADDRSLYVSQRGKLPTSVYRLDLSTGRKELWKQFMPGDPAGMDGISSPLMTSDGKAYVYGYYRALSKLYLVEGLK